MMLQFNTAHAVCELLTQDPTDRTNDKQGEQSYMPVRVALKTCLSVQASPTYAKVYKSAAEGVSTVTSRVQSSALSDHLHSSIWRAFTNTYLALSCGKHRPQLHP